MANRYHEQLGSCRFCGRWTLLEGSACASCPSDLVPGDEAARFRAICKRYGHKFTDRSRYLSRRELALRTAAIAFARRARAVTPEEKSRRQYRLQDAQENLSRVDDLWNYMHPDPSDWVAVSRKRIDLEAKAKQMGIL